MNSFLLVSSDIHSDVEALKKLTELASDRYCHAFLYCGDLDTENWEIQQILLNRNCTFIPVLGNCDSPFSYRDAGFNSVSHFRKTEFFNLKIFMTHGHFCTYPSDVGLEDDYFDLIIRGHSHIPLLQKQGNLVFLNPGSPSSPRGHNQKSYGIIEFNEGVARVSIRALTDNSTISELRIIPKKPE